MLLLADENFPFASYKFLKEKGYDIKHVSESDGGITDEEVIKLSVEEQRIVKFSGYLTVIDEQQIRQRKI